MSRASEALVTIKGTHLGESAKAIKFEIKEVSGEEITPSLQWIPISQTKKIMKNPNEIGEDSLVVTEWIIKTKGLLNVGRPKVIPNHAPETSPRLADSFDSYDDDIPY